MACGSARAEYTARNVNLRGARDELVWNTVGSLDPAISDVVCKKVGAFRCQKKENLGAGHALPTVFPTGRGRCAPHPLYALEIVSGIATTATYS